MESKATRLLATILLVSVVFLSLCDVIVTLSSPWWLHTLYATKFAAIRVMLGYNYSKPAFIYPMMLTFFLISGALCFVILLAAVRILLRIRQHDPFCIGNAVSLRNAAFCSFGLFIIFMLKMSFSPSILTFVCGGMFLLFGLFVLVISQLVRAATLLREDNELTI